jgi:hypothetical protein
MTESYKSLRDRMARAAYLKRVVQQPTQQSNVKAKLDKNSPTGISRDKAK